MEVGALNSQTRAEMIHSNPAMVQEWLSIGQNWDENAQISWPIIMAPTFRSDMGYPLGYPLGYPRLETEQISSSTASDVVNRGW